MTSECAATRPIAMTERGGVPGSSSAVTYLIGAGDSRGAAFEARAKAAADGWLATLYADGTGWVIRLCRIGPLRQERLARDQEYVERLARQVGFVVRATIIEPLRPTDEWAALAARVREECSAAPGNHTFTPTG